MKLTKNHYLGVFLSSFLVACGGNDNDSDSKDAVKKDSETSKDASYVRVLHASPDAPNVDILVDGVEVLNDVAYQQGSGYLQVDAGARDVSIRVSGTETIALEASFDLAADGYYSVIAQNQVASLEFEVLDDTTKQNNGTTDVTVVHASPTAGNVDVYVSADGAELPDLATLADVPFDVNAALENVASADYQVRITGAGSDEVLYNSSTLPVSGDVTAVAVNSTKGVSPVSLLIWTNSVTAVLDATAEVRIVHAVDSVSVDVFAGGAELLGDFNYKDTTGYVTVASGDLPVAIAPANGGIDASLDTLSGTLTLERGESYTVIAAGDVNDLPATQLIVLNDMREVSAEGAADVRLVHASAASAADPVDIFVAAAGSDISTATPTFADVVIGQDTGYTALSGTTAYDVVIAADGTTAAAVPGTANLTLGDNTVTTAIAVGNSVQNLEAIILSDKRSSMAP